MSLSPDGPAGSPSHIAAVNYRADIDGLRAIAVTLVVLFHASSTWVPGGYIGVDVFFVISGFLITKIVYSERIDGQFSYVEFYRRRIKRLLPAFSFVVLAVFAAGMLLSLPDHLVDIGQSIFAAAIFAPNILYWQEANYFAGAAEIKPLLNIWSLAVEEQFYLIYPALLFVGIKLFGRKGAFFITAFVFLASFAASVIFTTYAPQAAFFLLPFRAWELMLGSMLAIGSFPQLTSTLVREVITAFGLGMILIAGFGFSAATDFPGYAALLPTLGSASILYAAGGDNRLSRLLLQSRPVVHVGRISYSLYLWHWPILAFARYRSIGEVPAMTVLGLVAAAFLLADLTYRFIEQPYRQKGRFEGTTPFWFVLISSAAMLLAGAVLVNTSGLPERFNSHVRSLIAVRQDRDATRSCLSSGRDWRSPEQACAFGASGVAPTVALWGDSHGQALGATIDKLAAEQGRAVRFYGYSGCPPLLGVDSRSDCERYASQSFDHIVNDRAIDTVVLVARHGWYIIGDTAAWGPAEAPAAPGAFPMLEPAERKALYFAALRTTVARLREADKRVILVTPIPEAGYDVPHTAALLALQSDSIDDFTRPRLMYEARQSETRSVIFELAAQPGVALVDPARWMCDKAQCVVSLEGHLLYYDDDHLSNFAAARVARDILFAAEPKPRSSVR